MMQKKRILIFPFNLMSHYLRCITLAKRYSNCDILFASSGSYNSFVFEAGYQIFETETFDAELVMKQAAEFSFAWLNKTDIEKVFLSQVKVIQDLKPDLVIGDTSPTLKMAAEKTGVTYISLMNGYMSKYYKGVRPVSRTHYSYKYMLRLSPGIRDFITVVAERAAFKAAHRPFRSLRKKHKLNKLSSYLDELEGDQNLICDEERLFPQQNLPENYEVIGALMYRSQHTNTEEVPAEENGKPGIAICLGSSGNWESLSFLQQDKYQHLRFIVAGDHRRILKGKQFIHRSFVNFDAILPHCSLMICHGGNGTIYEGLKHNTFMLFITHHFEQEWNAMRVQDLGYGRVINDAPEMQFDACLGESVAAQLFSETPKETASLTLVLEK